MFRWMLTIRTSVLVMLVITSVVGAGMASADGSSTATLEEAIEYDGTIELALDSDTGSGVAASDVQVWVDGDQKSVDVAKDGTDGRIVLTGLDDVGPHENLVVNVDSSDVSTGNVSVIVTGSVLEAGREGNFFPGADVAYVASTEDVRFDIFRGNSFVAERSTGPNSQIYVIDTDGMEIGPSYYVNESSGHEATTEFHMRDLGLTATSNTTSVEGGGSFSVSTSSRGSDRPMLFHLVDTGSGETVATKEAQLSGDGEASVAFNDVASGTYRVDVEDTITGITASTDDVSVGETAAGTVSFASKTPTEERGDVVPIVLEFEGEAAGGTAEVTLGGSDAGFEVSVDVEDTDGDGRAVVHWNTANSPNASGGVWVSGGNGAASVTTSVQEPVVAGEYPVTVAYGGEEVDIATAMVRERATDGVTVLTAPTSASGLDSPAEVQSATTETEAVALDERALDHDWVVVRVDATGLGGYVHDAADIDGANGLTLSIVQTDASTGENQDPLEVEAADATLIPDQTKDTYYLAFRPENLVKNAEPGDEFQVTFTVDGATNDVTETTQEVTTTFEFVNGTVSFDTEDGTLLVRPASGATVAGTSTFAPGTEVTVNLRREGGSSPFTVDGTATVQPDGTWTTSFDLSDRPEGQEFTASVAKDGHGRERVPGQVSADAPQGTTTDDGDDESTAGGADGTPTDGTAAGTADGQPNGETPTQSTTEAPGFGPAFGVLALLAALSLLRRE